MSAPSKPRRTQRNRGPSRKFRRYVHGALHSARLLSAPSWYESPGRYKPPPEIPNAPQYFVKQRVILTTSALSATPTFVTYSNLATYFTTAFSSMFVSRIDAWGPSTDGTLALTVGVNTEASGFRRTFFGTGISGQRRPYVSVMISKKDQSTFPSGSGQAIVEIQFFDSAGDLSAGNCIVDFHNTYMVTGSQLLAPSPPESEPAYYASMANGLESPCFLLLHRNIHHPSHSEGTSTSLCRSFESLALAKDSNDNR